MDANAYLSQLQALLPPGRAWAVEGQSRLTAVLSFIAGQLAEIDARATTLLSEAHALSLAEMITDWETEFALPDNCTGQLTTLQERRMAVLQRMIDVGGHSKQHFVEIAATLGYPIAIDEFKPFVCGTARCGDALQGGDTVRHYWRVRVMQPRVTSFRVGSSSAGERLLQIEEADDLNCLFNRIKPAHTHLIFSYQGE